MKHITIIGCGGVGSLLSSHIAYKSITDPYLSELTLIDSDKIEPVNLPYLFLSDGNAWEDESPIGHSKVTCLESQLDRIKPSHLTIHTHHAWYQNRKSDIQGVVIDCRDTLDELDFTKFKLCVDGKYGNVIVNPSMVVNSKPTPTEYSLNKDIFYTNYFCAMVCDKFIFSDHAMLQSKRQEYTVEIEGMVFHERS